MKNDKKERKRLQVVFQSLFVPQKSGVIFLTEYDISQMAPRLRHGINHDKAR